VSTPSPETDDRDGPAHLPAAKPEERERATAELRLNGEPAEAGLNRTPMHPEYPSQATINATIALAVLESVFGSAKVIPFTATDVRDPKRTRQFASLADMAEEQKNVRVWGGVHYRFAIRTSEDVGPKVAAYMIANTLKPVR
jgi:hypothetical protein